VNLTKRADDWMNVHFLKVVNFLDGECHRLLDRARFFNVLKTSGLFLSWRLEFPAHGGFPGRGSTRGKKVRRG